MKYRTIADSFNIDLSDFEDCYLKDNFGNVKYNPFTKEPMIDFEKLKLRFVTAKYKTCIDIQKGLYYSKEAEKSYINTYPRFLDIFFDNVIYKCLPSVQMMISSHTGEELTAQQGADLRNLIREQRKVEADIQQQMVAEIQESENVDYSRQYKYMHDYKGEN